MPLHTVLVLHGNMAGEEEHRWKQEYVPKIQNCGLHGLQEYVPRIQSHGPKYTRECP